MGRAEAVGGELHVPRSFDTAHGGYSDAPGQEPRADHENGHRALLLGILERALADCRAPTAKSPGASGATFHDRAESLRFICEQTGPRARWRHELLSLVGLDPDGFDRLVALERDRWPELDAQAHEQAKERQREQMRRYHERKQAERRREQARQCMAKKRARERAQPAESDHCKALLAGSGITAPTYRDR